MLIIKQWEVISAILFCLACVTQWTKSPTPCNSIFLKNVVMPFCHGAAEYNIYINVFVIIISILILIIDT